MNKSYRTIKASALVLALALSREASAQYCSAVTYYSGDEEIYNVMLNGAQTNPLYSFSNGCSTPAPGPGSSLSLYSNFITLGPLTTLIQGASSTFSVAEDECDGSPYYSNGIGIWIDFNQNGVFTDPGENIYLSGSTVTSPQNVSGTFVVPIAAATGSTVMRVIASEGYAGASLNPCNSPYYGEVEDYRVDVIAAIPCSGVPPTNTVVTPITAICPGTSANLSLSNNYTVTGITYLWQSSTTSSLGPWTSVPNGTTSTINTPTLGAGTWYQAVITCTNGGGNVTTSSSLVQVQNTTTNTVPYYETFEGITGVNKLPNCSWMATNLNSTSFTKVSPNTQNQIAHSGTKFAEFYYYPAATNNFYSNGIWLEPNVTYSAGIWYTTEYYGYTNWALKLQVGPSQSQTGMMTIANASVASSPSYKAFGSTFTVATAGLYYMNVQGISNGNCCAYYLSWDDLSVTAPCALNTPTVALTANTTSVCAGQQVNLSATGADTYMWSNGSTGQTLNEAPAFNTNYMVVGTNAVTGCTASASQFVVVNPSPQMGIFANNSTVCSGSPVVLSAFGADTYSWSTGSNNQNITVNPTSMTSYTVLGTNSYGCTGSAVQTINVNTLPTIQATGPATICKGESTTLQAAGGNSYKWMANTLYIVGNPVVVSPMTSTSYTVEGTDANGCAGTYILSLGVDECTGISVNSLQNGFSVYPNPTGGVFTVEMKDASAKTIEVVDMIGRVVLTSQSSSMKANLNLNGQASGVYYVRIKSGNAMDVVKLVKE